MAGLNKEDAPLQAKRSDYPETCSRLSDALRWVTTAGNTRHLERTPGIGEIPSR